MRILLSGKAIHDYQEAPDRIQQAADKQLSFLLKNLRHPSLRVKKYNEAKDITIIKHPQ